MTSRPAGFITNSTTFDVPTLESLAETMRAFEVEQSRIDRELVNALSDYIAQSRAPLTFWANQFRVTVEVLVEVLGGRLTPVPGLFWDRVRAVFDPQSQRASDDSPGQTGSLRGVHRSSTDLPGHVAGSGGG